VIDLHLGEIPMGISGLLGVITLLCILGVIAGVVLATANTARGRSSRPGVLISIVAFIAAILFGTLSSGLHLIQPYEIGVVFRQTGNNDLRLPLQPGLKWVVPFVDQVVVYNAGQQNIDMLGAPTTGSENPTSGNGTNGQPAVSAITKDGQQIYLDTTVIFQINTVKVNDIHRNWPSVREEDPAYVEGYIIPETRSAVRDAVSEYSAEEIYSGGRAAIETQITDALRDTFAEKGFLLTSVLIRNISFSQEFTQAIEQKQIAQQQAQQAAFRVQQAQQEAEQARVQAQGEADAAVITAKGNAQSTVLEAEAKAKALDLINQILSQNPNLLQYEYINQLGDNVRLIIIPSNSPFLFDLKDLLEQAGATTTNEPLPTPVAPPTDDNSNDNQSPNAP
jgi:regulator of protease activity HflC (stomatin/prohibitin superfamily)